MMKSKQPQYVHIQQEFGRDEEWLQGGHFTLDECREVLTNEGRAVDALDPNPKYKYFRWVPDSTGEYAMVAWLCNKPGRGAAPVTIFDYK